MSSLAWGTESNMSDEKFYNREKEVVLLKRILNTLEENSSPTVMLSGIRGIGKTSLLKKIKNELEKDYLISYIDLTRIDTYQTGKLTKVDLVNEFYNTWMEASSNKKLKTTISKIKKYFQTKNFKIKELISTEGYPIPVIETEDNYKKLSDFVLELPQKIYEQEKNKIKGVIMIIDEFQALKDLGDGLDNFLWLFRSVIQNQNNVAYIFSGSINSRDNIIEKIAGRKGAFGGRMLTIEIEPFTKNTVYKYLKEKLPSLIFEDDGFERFYSCTRGIPHYVNTFAQLLEKNTPLTDKKIKKEFQNLLPFLALHLINLWSGLTLREQKIVTSLSEGSLERRKIAKKLNISSSSLSTPLQKLLNEGLIEYESKGVYTISEPILKEWLKQEYLNKGIYPYRSLT
ncbi:MAG: ATP-binding protein [Methanobrevibacter sp.]|jgi:AAA+ ATPase superfamily predicted ATPase|nr:ATP-binding protein [Candidatus Methanovirga aequatorialis]